MRLCQGRMRARGLMALGGLPVWKSRGPVRDVIEGTGWPAAGTSVRFRFVVLVSCLPALPEDVP